MPEHKEWLPVRCGEKEALLNREKLRGYNSKWPLLFKCFAVSKQHCLISADCNETPELYGLFINIALVYNNNNKFCINILLCKNEYCASL